MLRGMTEPRRELVRNGVLIRRQAPIVGDYCKTPDKAGLHAACGHKASTCHGVPRLCERCRFPYCEHHFPTHVKPFAYPKDAWATVTRRFHDALEKAAATRGKSPVRVRVPRIKADP